MTITDETIIHFGTHQGSAMEDVPADWILWLESNIRKKTIHTTWEKAFLEYAEDNKDELEKEMKNN